MAMPANVIQPETETPDKRPNIEPDEPGVVPEDVENQSSASAPAPERPDLRLVKPAEAVPTEVAPVGSEAEPEAEGGSTVSVEGAKPASEVPVEIDQKMPAKPTDKLNEPDNLAQLEGELFSKSPPMPGSPEGVEQELGFQRTELQRLQRERQELQADSLEATGANSKLNEQIRITHKGIMELEERLAQLKS